MTEQPPTPATEPATPVPPPVFTAGGLHEAIAVYLAEYFEEVRGTDDTPERDRIEEVCESFDLFPQDYEWPEEQDLVTADTEELREVFGDVLSYCELDVELLPDFLGEYEEIASWSSESYAVMTAGSGSTGVLRSDGWVVVVTDETEFGGGWEFGRPFRESDDPGLRQTRLDALAAYGGLQDGVGPDYADLHPELRDITLTCPAFVDHYQEDWGRAIEYSPELPDRFIEELLPAFRAETGCDEATARVRLAELLPSGQPTDEAERNAIWHVWMQVRRGAE